LLLKKANLTFGLKLSMSLIKSFRLLAQNLNSHILFILEGTALTFQNVCFRRETFQRSSD